MKISLYKQNTKMDDSHFKHIDEQMKLIEKHKLELVRKQQHLLNEQERIKIGLAQTRGKRFYQDLCKVMQRHNIKELGLLLNKDLLNFRINYWQDQSHIPPDYYGQSYFSGDDVVLMVKKIR